MITANCLVCDAQIDLPETTEESEVLTCSECDTRLLVSSLQGKKATLEKAPEVEEDWGQ